MISFWQVLLGCSCRRAFWAYLLNLHFHPRFLKTLNKPLKTTKLPDSYRILFFFFFTGLKNLISFEIESVRYSISFMNLLLPCTFKNINQKIFIQKYFQLIKALFFQYIMIGMLFQKWLYVCKRLLQIANVFRC